MPRQQDNEYAGAYRIRETLNSGRDNERIRFYGPWATLQGAKTKAVALERQYGWRSVNGASLIDFFAIEKISGPWEEVQ